MNWPGSGGQIKCLRREAVKILTGRRPCDLPPPSDWPWGRNNAPIWEKASIDKWMEENMMDFEIRCAWRRLELDELNFLINQLKEHA